MFMCSCSDILKRQKTQYVSSKRNCASASFIHTETHRTCRIHIYILIFTYTVLTKFKLILPKFCGIPCYLLKFYIYDWIPRFRPRFPHRRDHRALHLFHSVYISQLVFEHVVTIWTFSRVHIRDKSGCKAASCCESPLGLCATRVEMACE